ncbi:MAG: hypothetical protein ABL994_13020, partial [Verrucomicrobiales bacterium]
EALPELAKARELDPQYDDKASLRIVIAQYQLEDIPQLASEARRYLEKTPPAAEAPEKAKRTPIPSQVLEFLGQKLAENKEYGDAEFFLTSITDPASPEKTSSTVWKLLAESRVKLKMHEGAVAAYDFYLAQTDRPSERAAAFLERGFAQLCLRDFEAARNSAQESLRSQKEGRTNAEARLLLGDISAANGNLEEAARDYLVVSQIFMDPEVTPKALTKAINAYRSLGDQEKAQNLTQQLSASYPNYVAPENPDREC